MKWESTRDALSADEVAAIGAAIRASPYVDANPLNYRFSDTRGFSVVAREAGLDTVRKQFPSFAPFLARVVQPQANAWYLNPLLVGSGSAVERHCDMSLRSYTRPFNPPFPYRVDVLYVDVPSDMEGGQLTLFGRDGEKMASLEPCTNLLVTFDGRMPHEVEPVHTGGAERISLVLEQYRLPWFFRHRIPKYRIQSSVSFDRFLEAALGEEEPDEPQP